MLKRNRLTKSLLSLGLLAVAVLSLCRRKPADAWEYETMAEPATEPAPAPYPRPRPRPGARMTVVAGLTLLFFAGASFTAVAGDQAATLLEDYEATEAPLPAEDALAAEPNAGEIPQEEPAQPEAATPAAPTPAPEAAPALGSTPEATTEAEADPALAHEFVGEPAAEILATEAPATEAPTTEAPAEEAPEATPALEAPAPSAAPIAKAPQAKQRSAKPQAARTPAAPKAQSWVAARAVAPPMREPEIEYDDDRGAATVWLNRALPDPTPASKRLTPRFAKQLKTAARRHGADWAAVLGVLRAQGSRGSAPATPVELDALAERLAGQQTWRAALALSGRTGFADRADALADYYRAVGLRTLVTGLKASQERLVKRLLKDERVWIYWGGQQDLEADRIDVRILVLIAYLAERHESVTVSSLFTGHRKFSRPGVISAHTYGQAVDIAAVGGTSVLGNSQPGGTTEEAVRSILLLPAELQPQQVISLLGLGGPSFPLADHGDHIHIGY
jgi:hypothetical protein